MMRVFIVALAFALLSTASAGARTAASPQDSTFAAPGQSTPGLGTPVRDADGQVLGRIESVTRDSSGRAVQVVVRTRGVTGVRPRSRALPITSLRPDGSGWSVPLRRREFDLLPAIRP